MIITLDLQDHNKMLVDISTTTQFSAYRTDERN